MATYDISTQDLPLWMRRARRGFDWGIIICIAFSIVAAWPFLLQPGLPRTNASENYVFRTADYAQAISEGRLYPRWSSNVLGGYGAPIPSFVPPGSAYIPALIQFFFTDDPVSAVRIVYLLSISLAGAAMYAFVMRRAGAGAGVLASALYVFSPYLASVAPHILGDLPTVMSMMLLPALLWSVDRLLARNRPPDILFVALTCAGLLLTQPQHALTGIFICSLYALWFTLSQDRRASWYLVPVGITLGIGMSSFFWLPALAERGEVAWTSTGAAQSLFLTLGSLLSLFHLPDPNELVHTPQLTLGLSIVFFTSASIVTGVKYRLRAGFQLFFLSIGLVLLGTAILTASSEIWLLGPIVLCLCIAGSSILLWQDRSPVIYLPALLIIAVGLSITSWFSPRWSDDFGSTDALAQVQYEQLGYGVAVMPTGDLLPLTTPPSLLPDQTLVNGFTSGSIRKIAVRTGVQVGFLAHTTHTDQFQIDVQSPGSLRILTAYFPGWTALLNNMPVQLHPDPATGLINVEVPAATSGELTITFGTTTIRTVAWLFSQVTLVLVVLITFRRLSRSGEAYEELRLLTVSDARPTGYIVIGACVLILLFATPLSPIDLNIRPGYALDGSTALHSRTEVGLEALAYRLERDHYRTGETISLTLYWRALRFLPSNYRTQVSLINVSSDERVSTTSLRHPGGYPTQRWLTNYYVTDQHLLTIPPNAPPGDYAIGIDVYNCAANCASQNRLTFFDEAGAPLGQTLVLPDTLILEPQ